jgi:hypothetical protein
MNTRRTVLWLFLAAAAVLAIGFLQAGQGQYAPAKPQAKQAKAQITPEEVKDHEATGFPLQGSHLQLTCDACHGGKEEPKPDCKTCHTPPHGSDLKKKCEDCHTPGIEFSRVKFRHENKDMWAFHKTDRCLLCHPDKKFMTASRRCLNCHADFHKGAVGQDCYNCHRQPAWNVTRFNHTESGFPLMGAHRGLECGDCHRDLQSFRIVPRPSSCASCHLGDQQKAPFPHALYGAGPDCQECHLQDKWEYAHSPFWFNIQTGSMAGLACDSCHKTKGDYHEYTCHDCHQGHAGDRNGRCLDCHAGGFPIKGGLSRGLK